MKLIDTHLHYNLEPLLSGQVDDFFGKKKNAALVAKKTWQDHWQEAKKQGLILSLVVGANEASSQKALEMAQQTQGLFAAVGIHPEEAEEISLSDAVPLIEKLAKEKKCLAIGEVGLDYYQIEERHTDNFAELRQKQQALFRAQILLAKKYQLPLVVHLRDQKTDAYREALNILKEEKPLDSVIFHCVSGGIDFLQQALEIPQSYFGFDGNISFKNAQEIRELFTFLQKKHPEKILLETDAPFLAPEGHRGEICEPWMIRLTAEYLQREFQFDPEQSSKNAIAALHFPENWE
jgi:TatD DNase family protein